MVSIFEGGGVAKHPFVSKVVWGFFSCKMWSPVKITSYSLEALHADASHLAHAIGPNLIEIRKFGDIFVQKQRFHVPKHRKLRVRAPRRIRLESPTATDMP